MVRKDDAKCGVENIYEILFYLKNNYLPHIEEQTFIEDIPQDDRFSFEEMSDYLKTFSKSVIEVENTTGYQQRGKYLDAIKCAEYLPSRFEDWIFKDCKIKEQAIYTYKNLYKLMIFAPKLLSCRVNMTYFIRNHDIPLNYFQR